MCIIYKLRDIHIVGVGAQHFFLLSRGTAKSVGTTSVWSMGSQKPDLGGLVRVCS